MVTSQDNMKQVGLLMMSQACFLAYSLTFITFSGLSGKILANDPAYATVPLSITLVMTAVSTGPLSLMMQRLGRRTIFLIGATSGVVGALLAATAIMIDSFILFTISALFVGPFQASAQYYRFAAGESVSPAKAPRAISLVLLGGLGAALLTPFGSSWFNSQFAAYGFAGAFLFAASVAALAFMPLFLFKNAKPDEASGEAEPAADKNDATTPRAMSVIIRQPGFAAAVVNGALGYAMMTFVMTATPLAMQICGFAATTSANVITGHAIAMFFPSLFTGYLIEKFGVAKILFCGHLLFFTAFLTALSGITLGQFSIALIALGVGWNFCFIGGTSLLTTVHRPSERGRVQGVNEVLIFGSSATASLAAGAILRFFGWETVNQAAFVMLVIAAVVTISWAVKRKSAPLLDA